MRVGSELPSSVAQHTRVSFISGGFATIAAEVDVSDLLQKGTDPNVKDHLGASRLDRPLSASFDYIK